MSTRTWLWSLESEEKLGMVASYCDPGASEESQVDSWGSLVSQPSQTGKMQASARLSLKNTITTATYTASVIGMILKVVSHPYVHMCKHMNIHTHTEAHKRTWTQCERGMKLEAERASILILNWASKLQTALYFFQRLSDGYFVSFSFLFVLFQILEFRTRPHSTVLSKSLGLSHRPLGREGWRGWILGEACAGWVTWALDRSWLRSLRQLYAEDKQGALKTLTWGENIANWGFITHSYLWGSSAIESEITYEASTLDLLSI